MAQVTPEELTELESKYLYLTFPNGAVWRVSAKYIAKQRAEYYAENDVNREDERRGAKDKMGAYERYKMFMDLYAEEYAYTLSDKSELIDWLYASNNWSDLTEGGHVEFVRFNKGNEPDYETWFGDSSEVEVVLRGEK